MRLVQFENPHGKRKVGVITSEVLVSEVKSFENLRELSLSAIKKGLSLVDQVKEVGLGETYNYKDLLRKLQILPPLDHPDPAHMLISGTGLTHLGSASARNAMHQKAESTDKSLTDSIRMFRLGIEQGKPMKGTSGIQPEWFYKGDGSIVIRPGENFPLPSFAEYAGEEPEIAGLYIIGYDRKPYRLGFAIGNEFSDHIMERRNYLYLAHSKLRSCSFGPELRTGNLPRNLSGKSRIVRNGSTLWEKEFLSGEDNMCHSIENLEYHHFKYIQFLRPGDVHVHFFGTATLSYADGIRTQAGDRFEVIQSEFGEPLNNGFTLSESVFQAGSMISL